MNVFCVIVLDCIERFGDCCCMRLQAGLLFRDSECGGPGLTATVDFLASGAAILPPLEIIRELHRMIFR